MLLLPHPFFFNVLVNTYILCSYYPSFTFIVAHNKFLAHKECSPSFFFFFCSSDGNSSLLGESGSTS